MSRHPNIHVSGLILSFSILASCNETFATKSIAAHDALPDAPISEIDDYARHFVDAIQPISFEESREYCGFFIETSEGNVRGTRPIAGTADSCSSGFIPINAIAAYHTHGGYLPQYFNEVPSINDAVSAIDAGLDEYVGTPGGRFWRIDGQTGVSRTLCGVGCLNQDPIFQPDPRLPIGAGYTIDQLRALQS